MSRKISAPEENGKSSPTVLPQQDDASAAVEQDKSHSCQDPWSKGFRFDDPYWDDAFDSWHNPTLRTCCRWG